MKINPRNSLLILAIAAALLAAGCGNKEPDGSQAHETESGVTFSAKKGLHVPLETAKIIGLEVADVEERTIAATFEFSAQVYRAASATQFASLQPSGAPTAMASGIVSANDAAKLSEGQTVSVQRGENGVQFPGRIVALKREFQKANGQVEVLLAISDEQKPLLVGEFVSVTLPVGREESVTAVPRSAMFRTAEGDFVYTVSGEHYVRTPIKLGAVNHEFVEATDGLYSGDEIVLQPVMTLWLAELQAIRGGKACADGH